MTLYEHYQMERAEGREEGRQEVISTAVDNALKKGLSLEEACAIVGISVEEYQKTGSIKTCG